MFLKTTSDGRQRAKQKRVEEDLERERKNQLDEQKRLYVPRLLNASFIQFSLAFKEKVFRFGFIVKQTREGKWENWIWTQT